MPANILRDLRLIILAFAYASNRLAELTGQDAAMIRRHLIKTALIEVNARTPEDLDRLFNNLFNNQRSA